MKYQDWLLQLTGLPTAAGCEDRVVGWVRRWAARRRQVNLRVDQFGNLELRRRGARSAWPIYFVAHMDHPSFVVDEIIGPRRLLAVFRGGVAGSYFRGSKVLLYHGDTPAQRGTVRTRPVGTQKKVEVTFAQNITAQVGDVLTWSTGEPRIVGSRLKALACDNLAGVATAVSVFDSLSRSTQDVRVLLTRAEEIGFVGTLGVCSKRLVAESARIIVLECSKAFAESPIGAGPVVRVGDRTSIFDPQLTYRIGRVAQGLCEKDHNFKWQRKLMPGGTCEATAFQAFGYTTACVCLSLGNYHNMDEKSGHISAEVISLSDYYALIQLLTAVSLSLGKPTDSLKAILATTFERGRYVLGVDGK